MSQHELMPRVNGVQVHVPYLHISQHAAEGLPSSHPAARPRGFRLSVLTWVLAVTLPLTVLSIATHSYADVLLRPPADLSTTEDTAAKEAAAEAAAAAAQVARAHEEAAAQQAAAQQAAKAATDQAAAQPEAAKAPFTLPDGVPAAAWLGPTALIKQGLTALQWSQVSAQAQAELKNRYLDGFVYSPRIASIFAQHGIDGSFIAQRLGTNYLFGYNFLLAQQEFEPGATFNFVSTYLSLVLHAVPNIDVKFLNFRRVANAPILSRVLPRASSEPPLVMPYLKDTPLNPLPPQARPQLIYRPDSRVGPNMGQTWPEPWRELQDSFGPDWGAAQSAELVEPTRATPAMTIIDEARTLPGKRTEPLSADARSAQILQPDPSLTLPNGAQVPLYPAYAYDSDTSLRGAFVTGNAKVNSYWAELVDPSRIQQALEFLGLSSGDVIISDFNKRTFWRDRTLQYSLISEVSFLNRLAQCALTGSSLQPKVGASEVVSAAQIGQMMTWAHTENLVDHALIAAQTQRQAADRVKSSALSASLRASSQQAKEAVSGKDVVIPTEPGRSAPAYNAAAVVPRPPVLTALQQQRQDICKQVLDVAVVAVFNQDGKIVRLSNGRGNDDLSRYHKYYVLYGKSNVLDGGSVNNQQQIYRYAGLVSDEQGRVVSFALAVPLGPHFSVYEGSKLLTEILQAALLLPSSHDSSVGLALQACERVAAASTELYGSKFGANNVFSAVGEGDVSLLKMPLTNFGLSAEARQAQTEMQHGRQLNADAPVSARPPAQPEEQVAGHVLTLQSTQRSGGDSWVQSRKQAQERITHHPLLDGRTGAASKNSAAELNLAQVATQSTTNDYASYRQGMLNDIKSERYPHTEDSAELMTMLEDDKHGLEGKEVLHAREGRTAGSVRRSVFANSVLAKAQDQAEQVEAGVSAELVEQNAHQQRQDFYDVIDEISRQETPVSALERQSMVRASTEAAQSALIMKDIAEQRRAQTQNAASQREAEAKQHSATSRAVTSER